MEELPHPGAELIWLPEQKVARFLQLTMSDKPLSPTTAEFGAQSHFVKMLSAEAKE